MKTDYPELKGIEVTFHLPRTSRTFTGIVIGASYHQGITVINIDDEDHKLVCLNRSVHKDKCQIGDDLIPYRTAFYRIIKQLKSRVYTFKDIHGGNDNCAFT